MMEAFLDYMAFVCIAGAVIGFILGGWCWLCEKIIDKFWSRDKFIEFMCGDSCEDDFDYDED